MAAILSRNIALLFGLLIFANAGAQSWMMIPFVKVDEANPCLLPSPKARFQDPIWKRYIAWEAKDVFNPAAVVRHNKIHLLYRAEDSVGKHAGTSRIGLAKSSDGLSFSKKNKPVFYPRPDAFKKFEWEGGCEDPRIVEDERGTYYMTYTAYDGKTARLMIATSRNLKKWTKHGPVFRNAAKGRYVDLWSKSGAIVTEKAGNSLVAKKINGLYWMYWGDSHIYAATSTDLLSWTPVEETDPLKQRYDSINNHPAFKIVFAARPGKFDSELVEPGPPAIIRPEGILFIYNSRNHPLRGDTSLPAGTYAAGQVLIDKNDPLSVLDRSQSYFFKPDKPYEITGQVNNVCFVEGLVPYNGKWFLYYGTADSRIAVAVYSPAYIPD